MAVAIIMGLAALFCVGGLFFVGIGTCGELYANGQKVSQGCDTNWTPFLSLLALALLALVGLGIAILKLRQPARDGREEPGAHGA